jgi:hypothetical protein
MSRRAWLGPLAVVLFLVPVAQAKLAPTFSERTGVGAPGRPDGQEVSSWWLVAGGPAAVVAGLVLSRWRRGDRGRASR